jgi:hypothetical protein
MAKRLEDKAEGHVPSAAEFKKVIRKLNASESKLNEARGEMGSTVESAIAAVNMHKDALRIVRKYAKKSPEACSEFITHFVPYWMYMNLAQSEDDMFRGKAPKGKKGKVISDVKFFNAAAPAPETDEAA